MVDAGERGLDESSIAQEEGKHLKHTESNTLRTQQAIARFGKAVRHPLCQAWLEVWRQEAELSKIKHEAILLDLEVLKRAKKQKQQAQALLDQFYKEGKQKESIEAAALVRDTADILRGARTAYEASVKLFTKLTPILRWANARFKSEYSAAIQAKDAGALKALRYLKKTLTSPMSDGHKRVFGILKMLRDKTIKATWAKNEAAAGYWEAASGGERPLSDEFWQGRPAGVVFFFKLQKTRSRKRNPV